MPPQNKAEQLHFPIGGVMKRYSIQNQPNYTTPGANNIRPEAVDDLRYKGGTRSGLAKHFTDQVGAGQVNLLSTVRWISSNAFKSTLVAAAAGVLKYEESDGTLSTAVSCAGLSNSAVVVSATQLVHAVDLFQKLYIADWDPDSTVTDRAPKVFNPSTNTLAKLAATDGTVPLGCPCIAAYRGRLLLGGARSNPHLLYGSRIGDPGDWDSGDVDPGDRTGPFVLGAADAFTVGQPITAIIPTSDECCLICCTNSIWIMKGDPLDGGGLSNISRDIGIVSHGAWCATPEGAIIFLSHDGLYMMYARCSTQPPESLSRDRLPESLLNLGAGNRHVNLAYDIFSRGVHIMVAPIITTYTNGTVAIVNGVVTLTGGTWPASDSDWTGGNKRLIVAGHTYTVASRDSGSQITLTDLTVNVTGPEIYSLQTATSSSEHHFFDWKNRGFWPQTYQWAHECTAIHAWKDYPDSPSYTTAYAAAVAAIPTASHPTSAAHAAVANQSTVLIGCRDGFIRRHLTTATDDDGVAISSYLYYGPFSFGQGFQEGTVQELTGFLGLESGHVTATLYVGTTGEQAFSDPQRASPPINWTEAGRNPTWYPRLTGSDFILLLEDLDSSIWTVERLDLILAPAGRLRR